MTNINEKGITSEPQRRPEPAESFGIEYSASRSREIMGAMRALGFRFIRSGSENEDNNVIV